MHLTTIVIGTSLVIMTRSGASQVRTWPPNVSKFQVAGETYIYLLVISKIIPIFKSNFLLTQYVSIGFRFFRYLPVYLSGVDS